MAFKLSSKLLAYVCQIEILDISVCLMWTQNVDALPWPMLAAVILIYSIDIGSRLMIGCYLILSLDNSEISNRSYATKITSYLRFEQG